MTGYGEARCQSDQLSLSIELRALNNRYLKVSLRAPDPYHLLEAEFEKVIRKVVKRGTIQVHLRCEHHAAADDFRINPVALASYVQQIRDMPPSSSGWPNGGRRCLMSQADADAAGRRAGIGEPNLSIARRLADHREGAARGGSIACKRWRKDEGNGDGGRSCSPIAIRSPAISR